MTCAERVALTRSSVPCRQSCWAMRLAAVSHVPRSSTASSTFIRICPKGACFLLPRVVLRPIKVSKQRRYQISQYDQPLAEHGSVEVALPAEEGGGVCRVRITRAHLEEVRRA